jgi:hypothetical protein
MHSHNRDIEKSSGQATQNMSHGQNLSSTSGEPEFVGQEFFEIPASERVLYAENASAFYTNFFPSSKKQAVKFSHKITVFKWTQN